MPTHWVAAPATHLYPEPRVQARELGTLSMGARLTVLGTEGQFTRTTRGFVPTCHLRPLGDWHKDPVAVAQTFLGTPYLWGGNSRAGLDCSGLVQAAFAACGIAVPGGYGSAAGGGSRGVRGRFNAAIWCSGKAMWRWWSMATG